MVSSRFCRVVARQTAAAERASSCCIAAVGWGAPSESGARANAARGLVWARQCGAARGANLDEDVGGVVLARVGVAVAPHEADGLLVDLGVVELLERALGCGGAGRNASGLCRKTTCCAVQRCPQPARAAAHRQSLRRRRVEARARGAGRARQHSARRCAHPATGGGGDPGRRRSAASPRAPRRTIDAGLVVHVAVAQRAARDGVAADANRGDRADLGKCRRRLRERVSWRREALRAARGGGDTRTSATHARRAAAAAARPARRSAGAAACTRPSNAISSTRLAEELEQLALSHVLVQVAHVQRAGGGGRGGCGGGCCHGCFCFFFGSRVEFDAKGFSCSCCRGVRRAATGGGDPRLRVLTETEGMKKENRDVSAMPPMRLRDEILGGRPPVVTCEQPAARRRAAKATASKRKKDPAAAATSAAPPMRLCAPAAPPRASPAGRRSAARRSAPPTRAMADAPAQKLWRVPRCPPKHSPLTRSTPQGRPLLGEDRPADGEVQRKPERRQAHGPGGTR